ncbi:hypothetical protein FQN54_005578 [Arachnomyces sp. PD_36]|nr:hypothetical protein FQN54_005578 [Arachnomyces sp. PD_36]
MGVSLAAPVANVEHAITNSTIPDHVADPAVLQARGLATVNHVGQATFFITGLGSCGDYNNGEVDDIVALSHGLMGEKSYDNKHCNQQVMISYNGRHARGIVKDKCMGCVGESIDLSLHLFRQLADPGAGRLHGVEWHFVNEP